MKLYYIIFILICSCVTQTSRYSDKSDKRSCLTYCYDEYNRGQREERKRSLELEQKIRKLEDQLEACNKK